MIFSKTYYIVACIVGFLGLIGVLIVIVFYIYPVFIKELILKFYFNMDEESIKSFFVSFESCSSFNKELFECYIYLAKMESDLNALETRLGAAHCIKQIFTPTYVTPSSVLVECITTIQHLKAEISRLKRHIQVISNSKQKVVKCK
jgi:hypothetical protein